MVSLRHKIILLILMTPTALFPQIDAVRADVQAIVHDIPGTFGVAFVNLETGEQILLNEREMFHAASTMKTPVMIEVFRQRRLGAFSLDDSILVKNEFRSIVDGSSYQLDLGDDSDDSMYKMVGQRSTIRHLLHQMITVSSNLATNILIDLVDARSVTATMRMMGAGDIEVLRGVEDGKAFERGLNNRTNAHDLLVIMRSIASGMAVDSASSEEMMNILLQQHFGEIIPALLPVDVRVAHKTGSITGVEHDSGIVLLPDGRRYVVVLLSKGLKDAAAGQRALALVSKRLYDYVVTGR